MVKFGWPAVSLGRAVKVVWREDFDDEEALNESLGDFKI